MNFSLFKKSRSLVGLDIGSSAVKAVELKAAGKGYRVTAFASEPIPPDSIVDGAILDSAAVAEAIRRVFETKGFKTKEVAASSRQCRDRQKISLPVMTATELDDPSIGKPSNTSPSTSRMSTWTIRFSTPPVRTRRARWKSCWSPPRKKNQRLHGRHHQPGARRSSSTWTAFALQNAFELNYGFEPKLDCRLLKRRGQRDNINIISNGQSVFTRDISLGGNAYTEAVQRELTFPFAAAELLKHGAPVDAQPSKTCSG